MYPARHELASHALPVALNARTRWAPSHCGRQDNLARVAWGWPECAQQPKLQHSSAQSCNPWPCLQLRSTEHSLRPASLTHRGACASGKHKAGLTGCAARSIRAKRCAVGVALWHRQRCHWSRSGSPPTKTSPEHTEAMKQQQPQAAHESPPAGPHSSPQLTGVQRVFESSSVEPAAHVLQVKVVPSKLTQLGTPPCSRAAGLGEAWAAAAQSYHNTAAWQLPRRSANVTRWPPAHRPEHVAGCSAAGSDAHKKAAPLDSQRSRIVRGWHRGSGP